MYGFNVPLVYALSEEKGVVKIMVKRIFSCALAAILLVACTAKILSYSNKVNLKNEYQHELIVSLFSIQVMINSAIENNNRADIRNAALKYERMGTVFATMSSQLFDSFLDSGEWGKAARILLGNNSPSTLFQTFDEPLSEEEINFLTQISAINQSLFIEISDDSNPQGVRELNNISLERILNNHHQNTLKEFLASL